MKTILHVIDTTGPGGAETVFIELADRLRARGFRSIVVIRGPGWVNDSLRERGLEPVTIDAKGSFNLPFLHALIALIRRENVSLIQSHLLGSNVYCSLAGLLTGRPVVGTFHGMVDISPNERFRRAKLWVMERGIKRFVAVSRGLADRVAAEGLLNPAKTTVIYNGIDTARYGARRPGSLQAQLRLPAHGAASAADTGAAADSKIALSIGNVRPAKAYDVLIAAAARLRETRPELHFVVAGDIKKSLMETLAAQMRELGVDDRVHFIGFAKDPAALLAGADVFVLSSSSEGFSISTVEALAAGVPAVVTRCGGPEEIVEHDVDAWMVPTGNADALAQGIDHLLAHPERATALAAAGQRKARERFDIQVMVDQYQAIYTALIG